MIFCVSIAQAQSPIQTKLLIQHSSELVLAFETPLKVHRVIQPIEWELELNSDVCKKYRVAHQTLTTNKFNSLNASFYDSLGIDSQIYQPILELNEKASQILLDDIEKVEDEAEDIRQKILEPENFYDFIMNELKESMPDYPYFLFEKHQRDIIRYYVTNDIQPKPTDLSALEMSYHDQIREFYLLVRAESEKEMKNTYSNYDQEQLATIRASLQTIEKDLFDKLVAIIHSDIIVNCNYMIEE